MGWSRFTYREVQYAEFTNKDGNVIIRFSCVDGSWQGETGDGSHGPGLDIGWGILKDGAWTVGESSEVVHYVGGLTHSDFVEQLRLPDWMEELCQDPESLAPMMLQIFYRHGRPSDNDERSDYFDRLDRLLLHGFSSGFDANESRYEKDGSLWTALSFAASLAQMEPVSARNLLGRILAAGADPHLVADRYGVETMPVGAVVLWRFRVALTTHYSKWARAKVLFREVLGDLLEHGLRLDADSVVFELGAWGQEDLVTRALEAGGNVDVALWGAVRGEQPELIATLLEKGANPNAVIGGGLLFFHTESLSILEQLVEGGADLDAWGPEGRYRPIEGLTVPPEELRAAGYSFQEDENPRLNDYLNTVCRRAVPFESDAFPLLEEELSKATDLAVSKISPLALIAFSSVSCRHRECGQYGAKLEDESAVETHDEQLAILAKRILDMGIPADSSHTLISSCRLGLPELVKSSLEAGADPNEGASFTILGWERWKGTALLVATYHNRVDAMRLLLEAGADPNLGWALTINHRGEPVRPPALRAQSREALELLVEFGADLTTEFKGRNALEHWFFTDLRPIETTAVPCGLRWNEDLVDVGIRLLELGVPAPRFSEMLTRNNPFDIHHVDRLCSVPKEKSRVPPAAGALVPFLEALRAAGSELPDWSRWRHDEDA